MSDTSEDELRMDRDRNGAGVPAILWSRMRHQILKRQNCHWRKPSNPSVRHHQAASNRNPSFFAFYHSDI